MPPEGKSPKPRRESQKSIEERFSEISKILKGRGGVQSNPYGALAELLGARFSAHGVDAGRINPLKGQILGIFHELNTVPTIEDAEAIAEKIANREKTQALSREQLIECVESVFNTREGKWRLGKRLI